MSATSPVLYLIDASSYVYRAFHALPPLTNASGLPTNAAYGFTTMLLKLLRDTAPQYVATIFDAPDRTFRDTLFADYKANRPPMPDDLAAQFPLVHEIVAALAIHSLTVVGVEADDVIGSIAVQMARRAIDTVIITADKDLMQLVGEHVTLWDTMRDRHTDVVGVRERLGVSPQQVVDVMALVGDPIDNIPGVKGIGDKTATALIQRFGDVETLLSHLDELESSAEIRGAKKIAAIIRANTATLRLSRQLATIRTDVAVDCDLERFHYASPDPSALRPIFRRLGFQRLLHDLSASRPALTVALHTATSTVDIDALGRAARQHNRMTLACDGTIAPGGVHLTGAVASAGTAMPLYLDLAPSSPWHMGWVALLNDPTIEKIGHDLKHDLRLLGEPHGALTPGFDVMLASYLLEVSATHRLEDLAADMLSANLPAFRGSPQSLANGVALLSEIRDLLAHQLRESDMEHLFYEVEMPLLMVLARMERRGVRLDVPALAAMSCELEARLAALVDEIYRLAGGAFNIGSPQQLRDVLFDRLGLSRKGVKRGKTGLSTDVDVLTRLAADHPLPAKILEYRALAKLKSTYVDALPAAVDPITGRLHTSFNQTVAATGRLSSSDPNLQNIPVRSEEGRRIRAAFLAAEGCILIAADYSQIELRVMAHLSEDPVLTAAFRAEEDVHARTAAEIFGVLPATVTPDMRRMAKVINFGIIYGMGAQRLARELGISQNEAERYIQGYFERHSGVRAYVDATQRQARERGYVTTLLGRRRALPDLASPHRGVSQAAERTATNTPIQGSAADLIKLAMVSIDRRLRQEGIAGAMILQIHDELIFEVAEGDRERTIALVRTEMENVFPLKVPLRVDIAWGRNWAEAH